tara:strand:- start:3025 stop:3480 length:456 start_codon:yes stop_codon:yes gene_type:complete
MEESKALLGAGCFWGVEETFRKIEGVVDTKVGYAGGNIINPSYEEVCLSKTGHAEVLKVEFNSNIISYDEILEIFWVCHDPTQLNQQGLDIGEQYRSVIFCYSAEQKKIATKSKNNFQKTLSKKIVTEIIDYVNFYLAEDYHQKYIQKKQK